MNELVSISGDVVIAERLATLAPQNNGGTSIFFPEEFAFVPSKATAAVLVLVRYTVAQVPSPGFRRVGVDLN
jgi:hypothetical protein